MWPIAVAVGIAAVWFEYSYRRSHPRTKKKNRGKKAAPPDAKSEQDHKSPHTASAN
jgi:hypothetical protein